MIQLPSGLFFHTVPRPRPFRTPVNTAEWMKIPEEEIGLYGLWTVQPKVSPWAVYRCLRGDPPQHSVDPIPHLVLHCDQFWIDDGHHRILAARLQGKRQGLFRLHICC